MTTVEAPISAGSGRHLPTETAQQGESQSTYFSGSPEKQEPYDFGVHIRARGVQVPNMWGFWSQKPLRAWFLAQESLNFGCLDPLVSWRPQKSEWAHSLSDTPTALYEPWSYSGIGVPVGVI